MRTMNSIRNPVRPYASAETIPIFPVELPCHKGVLSYRNHRPIDLPAMFNGQFLQIFVCAWLDDDAKRHISVYLDRQ